MTDKKTLLTALGLLALPAALLFILTFAKDRAIACDDKPAIWQGAGAGEKEILGPVSLGIALLRRNKVTDYQLNFAAFGTYRDLWEQRTIEGAWPIAYAPNSHTILSLGEIDRKGCRKVDQIQGLELDVCS